MSDATTTRQNDNSKQSRSSIYHPHRDRFEQLAFLIGNDTSGIRAKRNLKKALNHLELLKKKEAVALQLNLHNIKTPKETFAENYALLEAHQQKKITTQEAIEQLAISTGRTTKDVQQLLEQSYPLGHMELHVSDACNLRCKGCTYGQDVPGLAPAQISFPFKHLHKITALAPQSILFSGGGEPTLYKDKEHHFGHFVEALHKELPDTKLALITNGTYKPQGDWVNHLDWLRLSIDAATHDTFENFRGRGLFAQVSNNLMNYLNTTIPQVGGTFLYSKANIHEYTDFLRYFFNTVQRHHPDKLYKLNLTFRPLRQNPTDTGREFPDAIDQDDINQTVHDILDFAQEHSDHEDFLREQTNVEAVLGGNHQPPMAFSRCYYSQIFHIVRANGDVRPCFVRVLEPDFILGNIITDSKATIVLNALYIAARKKPHCNPKGCRQAHCNYILEQGLKGSIKPPTDPNVANDPFF